MRNQHQKIRLEFHVYKFHKILLKISFQTAYFYIKIPLAFAEKIQTNYWINYN